MKRNIAVWAVACLAMMMLAGPAMAADTIKIGFHAPLTGFAASDGKSATEGARLAVSQVNAAGGVLGKQLELVVYDDEAKPAQSIPIANKLIGQDKVVVGISGSYSGATRSAAGVFQESKLPTSAPMASIRTSPAPVNTYSAPVFWDMCRARPGPS
jgi:branched-chain amino acid transport system substrate-binding protein